MNWPLYKSMHARQLTQAKLAELTGINRSVLARILTNEPGRGKKTRHKLFPHLTQVEINLLGWGNEYNGWKLEQCATRNIFQDPAEGTLCSS
jgi:transcriptional regulator with XRE-family HTH domain